MPEYGAPRKVIRICGYIEWRRAARFLLLLVLAFLGSAQSGCTSPEGTITPVTIVTQTLTPPPLPSSLPPTPFMYLLPTVSLAEIQSTPTSSPTSLPTATPTPAPADFSVPYPLSQNNFVIPLTVRHVTEASATLFFELSHPTNGRLVYRSTIPEQPIQGEIEISAGETRHMITLEGLSPGVSYQALVVLGDSNADFQQPGFAGTAWGAVSFRTASNVVPLRIGVLGDASFGDQSTQKLVAWMATQNLDFVLHTGDVVYETDPTDLVNSYLLKFYEPLSPLLHQLPVYTVLGNHDYDASLEWQGTPFYDYAFPPFPDQIFSYPESRRGNQYYAFAYQDVQFLMLDSQVFYGVEGRAGQAAWLNERLTDPRFRVSIPIFHVAPYSSSVVHPDDGLPMRYTWGPLFESTSVPLSFSGHYHNYERLSANGVTYIVTGGGSSILYAQGNSLPESQIYVRRTHFVLMEIYTDRIELNAISMEGDILDQATITIK